MVEGMLNGTSAAWADPADLCYLCSHLATQEIYRSLQGRSAMLCQRPRIAAALSLLLNDTRLEHAQPPYSEPLGAAQASTVLKCYYVSALTWACSDDTVATGHLRITPNSGCSWPQVLAAMTWRGAAHLWAHCGLAHLCAAQSLPVTRCGSTAHSSAPLDLRP